MSRHPVSPTDTEPTPPTAEDRTMRELRPRQARAAARHALRGQLYRAIATRALAALALAATTGAVALATPATLAAQQSGRISGIVTDDGGQPIPSVQVSLVGTRFGATTDQAGRFTIVGVTPGSYQLRAQRIGYRPMVQAITVGSGEAVSQNLSLAGAATVLNQVAVVGYTTQARRDISDATAGVTADELQDQQVATIEESLRGRVPGVQINASGEPGRAAQIIVRGQNVFGASQPLYVVDGMYLRQNPNLNPDDIESIEVLKDASAAAQYGAQSAGGVIVIRTKRGRTQDRNTFELRSYYGAQDIPKRVDMMSSSQWAAIQQQAYQNANLPVPSGVTAALAGNATSTDWQDAVFDNGKIQNHNLTFSGATPLASYLIAAGVFDQQGTIVETGFRRYNFRVNSDISRGRFTLGENVALSRSNRDELSGFALIDVVRMLPTIPVRDPGNPSGYGYGSGSNPTFGTNPVAQLETRPRTDRSNQVIGSAYGEVKLFQNLKYRLNLGINYENFARTEFTSIAQIRQGSPNQFAELNEIRNDFTSLLAENLLTYDPSFRDGLHRINAVAGLTSQRIQADDISAYRRGFSDESLRRLNAGESANASNSGTLNEAGLQGMLARAAYTLADRYLFTGSVRRDGSSRFGANNRYGTFSAFSAGWVASQEDFFKAIPVLGRASFLKLRASTGGLGSEGELGYYRTEASINSNRLGYTYGSGGVIPGATQLGLANPNLKWQETQTTNVGLDMGALDDRLTFTMDVYRTDAKDALVTAPLPWSLGVGEDDSRSPSINAGRLRNSGTEFGLTYRYGEQRASQAFRLNSTATLTTTRNRVVSLGDGGQPIFDQTGAARTAVGAPVGTFYLVRTAGIFQSAAEVQAHTTTLENGTVKVIQPGAQAGDVRFVDANGDGLINDDDRVEMGNGTPKYSYGLFFDGGWHAFDFALNLRGAGGFKIFNVARYWTDRGDDPSNFRAGYSPWTATNPSTTTPRIVAAGNPNTRFLSDRWLEDGDYLRIQNIVVGVKLPTSLTSRLAGGRAFDSRVYLNVQNLHTFTDFSNWDPETLGYGNPLGRGIDDGRIYPNVRTVSFGLDLRL
jgi:TonB-dependent starch-binding outer membrane protein SusC